MHRYMIARVIDPNDPERNLFDLWALTKLGQADAKAFELADHNHWEEYLERVQVEPGKCLLIAYNKGDIDAVLIDNNKWIDAVSELRGWLDKFPDGNEYEIFWKFSNGSVRKYTVHF